MQNMELATHKIVRAEIAKIAQEMEENARTMFMAAFGVFIFLNIAVVIATSPSVLTAVKTFSITWERAVSICIGCLLYVVSVRVWRRINRNSASLS